MARSYDALYDLQYTGSQTNRFGLDNRHAIRTMLDEVGDVADPHELTGECEDFPRVARLRENLTALSQHYNLYFVAYKGWIHVYVPNRGARRLLGKPVALLDPKLSATPMSQHINAHISTLCPHSVNNMKVGDLGEQEILLVTRDNGDVTAWYTESIARQVERRRASRPEGRRDHDFYDDDVENPRMLSPRHFFAENVGASAWGLAIHKRDRLIAVSSNSQEVTVFALALGGDEPDAQFKDMPPGQNDYFLNTHPQECTTCRSPCTRVNVAFPAPFPTDGAIRNLERRFRTRTRTWRIVIPFGNEASNIPSVSFCEDEAGHADRVVALDIRGYLLVAEIWAIASRHISIPPHNVQRPNGTPNDVNVTGWSVLPVTDAQLLPTRSLKTAIGVHPKHAVYRAKFPIRGTWIDISRCMKDVDNDAAREQHEANDIAYEEEDLSGLHDGVDDNESFSTSLDLHISYKVNVPLFANNEESDTRLAMTSVPPTGEHYTEIRDTRDLVQLVGIRGALRRMYQVPSAQNLIGFRAENPTSALLRGMSFLRANAEDVEMLTLDKKEQDVGLVCHHVLPNFNQHLELGPWDMQFGGRCSMLITIPELHLVVLGSMYGRVALLTLTQPPQLKPNVKLNNPQDLPPRRAFRVDAVLPLKAEEDARQRPYVCLLGIAVSPVPETERVSELRRRRPTVPGGRRKKSMGASGGQPELEPDPPRRWRLVLNYMDHTVLQYEIVRKEDTGACKELLTEREWRVRVRELDDLGIGTTFANPDYNPHLYRRHSSESTTTTDEEMRTRVLDAKEEKAEQVAKEKAWAEMTGRYPMMGFGEDDLGHLRRYDSSDEDDKFTFSPPERSDEADEDEKGLELEDSEEEEYMEDCLSTSDSPSRLT